MQHTNQYLLHCSIQHGLCAKYPFPTVDFAGRGLRSVKSAKVVDCTNLI